MRVDDYRDAVTELARAVAHRDTIKRQIEDLTRRLEDAERQVSTKTDLRRVALARLEEALVLGILEPPPMTEAEAMREMKKQVSEAWRKGQDLTPEEIK